MNYTPSWQIRVHLSRTGVITDTFVYHLGKQTHAKHDWTDRHTLAMVVGWANRATNCDAELTSRHLTIVP